ncbi:MAG: hypothetical protein DVB23_002391 [Verrucomicrobia bacterium]|jgi:hypothetical protein|nr:MAG: hypothetical protein DVB23_002391 [Verrucomicrobiota bacterium]
MNVTTSAAGLAGMTKELMRVWDETTVSWRDAKADEFSQTYLLPIAESVESLAVAAEKLDRVIRQIRVDCE